MHACECQTLRKFCQLLTPIIAHVLPMCVSIIGTVSSILQAKRVLSNVHAKQCDSFIECSCQPLPKFHQVSIIAKALSSVNANHCDSFINYLYKLAPHIMNGDVILQHVLWNVTSSFMRPKKNDIICRYKLTLNSNTRHVPKSRVQRFPNSR